MAKLTSIYNFVPLNEQVYYPEWSERVSQDIPFSDGEDGIIDVTFHNVSPLFVRNGSADRNNQDPHSAHIMVGDKRLYFIPATSIKGMLRTTLEIISFGKMAQYNDRFFSKRELGGKLTPDGQEYVELMKGVKPAWLKQEGEKLFLTPCDGEMLRISDKELLKYPTFRNAVSAWEKNKALKKDLGTMYPTYSQDSTDYRIVCTGYINNKYKDYLFPLGKLNRVEVPDRVVKAFYTVHEPSPNYDDIMGYLKDGHELAVFYLPGKDAYDIKAVGLSKMLRYPYKQSVSDLVKNQQNPQSNKHDLTETIFGYTSKEASASSRGRVQVGYAFSDRPLADNELEKEVLGILGQPKASFYPFYLKQTQNPYKTYDNADGIAGRKLYRIHKASSVTSLPKGNKNENTLTHFRPLPSGQTFHLRIAVHNLRKIEIGALLSALTLHDTKGVWHNMGLAKGYGYGKLSVDNIRLSSGLSYSVTEYLREFELQMSLFTYVELPSKRMWADTPQIASLTSILGEHDDADLRVMEINSPDYGKEYVEAKRNFGKLDDSEKAIHVNSMLTEEDKRSIKEASFAHQKKLEAQKLEERKKQWIISHETEYKAAEAFLEQKNFDEAISKYDEIIQQLTLYSLNHDDEDELLNNAQKAKSDYHNKQQQAAEAQKQQAQEIKLKAGLGASLNEKYDMGPNNGNYKVGDYKSLNNRTDQWMKKTKETALTYSEKEAYASTFRRLYPKGCHDKKEDKALGNKDSGIWKNAEHYLGDRFEELLGDLYNTLK